MTAWLKAIGIELKQPMMIYNNNKPLIDIANSDKGAIKIKHIQVKYH